MELLGSLFDFTVSPLELFVRGSLMYWFLFLIFRFVLRRDVGSLGVADVLLLVLIADASQNAMADDYESVSDGFVLVSTLIGWNVLLDWASWRFDAVRKFIEPKPLLLVRHGRLNLQQMRRQLVTREDVLAALREHGVANIVDVRAAFMEADGKITVLLTERAKRAGGRSVKPPKDATPGATS